MEIYSAEYFPVDGYHTQRLRLLRHGLIQTLNDGVRNLCLSIFNTACSVKTQFSGLFPYMANMVTNSFRFVLSLVPTISRESDACLIVQVSLKDLIGSSSVMCSSGSNYYGWSNSEFDWAGLVHVPNPNIWGKPIPAEHVDLKGCM